MLITATSISDFVQETKVHQQNNQFLSPSVCSVNCYSISVSHLASAGGQNQSLFPFLLFLLPSTSAHPPTQALSTLCFTAFQHPRASVAVRQVWHHLNSLKMFEMAKKNCQFLIFIVMLLKFSMVHRNISTKIIILQKQFVLIKGNKLQRQTICANVSVDNLKK